ncbi:MAG: hypothetical protein N2Z82_12015 [Thermomicrobium sp.]|nr:hypothetical protein [Thermomicrobium sp.]
MQHIAAEQRLLDERHDDRSDERSNGELEHRCRLDEGSSLLPEHRESRHRGKRRDRQPQHDDPTDAEQRCQVRDSAVRCAPSQRLPGTTTARHGVHEPERHDPTAHGIHRHAPQRAVRDAEGATERIGVSPTPLRDPEQHAPEQRPDEDQGQPEDRQLSCSLIDGRSMAHGLTAGSPVSKDENGSDVARVSSSRVAEE